MSQSEVEDLSKLTLEDAQELSPPSPPKPINPFLSVPPELLSDILQHCKRPSYRAEKAEFARLSRVSKQFLPIAQQLLYRSITLTLRSSHVTFSKGGKPEQLNTTDKANKLLAILLNTSRCADLVQVLDVTFSEVPIIDEVAAILSHVLTRTKTLQQLWLIDRGDGFLSTDTNNVQNSARAISIIAVALTKYLKGSLKVLVVPQLVLGHDTINTLFSSLSQLETYKGTMRANPSDPSLRKKVVSQFRRLYITRFISPVDINFAISASTDSLRYLHLSFRKENESVYLGNLENLETLVLSAKLIVEPMVLPRGTNPSSALQSWTNEAPNKLISNVLRTAESARSIATLRHFSLLTNVHQFLPPHFEKFFLRFPSSIHVFSLDSYACHSLPWPIFLLNHRRLYPHLRKFILRRPKDSRGDNAADAKVYFEGIDDFEARSGIEIEWIEDDDKKWGYFTEKMFCPWATGEELFGKENEYAKKQAQAANTSCPIS
ncbi:hypothetical protein JCM3765_000490 [Sporobolomyces pararoseus]